MRPFAYQRADSAARAIAAFEVAPTGQKPEREVQFLAGGTTIVDLMKLDVMRPDVLVDINPLADTALGQIEARPDGLRIGALVRMADAAEHESIERDFPAVAQSLRFAASQQLRNMASLGGNVLQRTRCNYFRDTSYPACNKRSPGSGCSALDGYNRRHAVLGLSDQCIATYPGDFAQALLIFDASVEIVGPRGRRSLLFSDLHRTPGSTPEIETQLNPGEMIVLFAIPSSPWSRRSLYLKVRDRESYEFALASAAVALDLRDGVVLDSRIALGGVATVPWRATEAEDVLRGQRLDESVMHGAAREAFRQAQTTRDNAFKVELGQRTLVRALSEAAALEIAP